MKELMNLLKVKSLVTVVLTGVFSYLAITGKVQSSDVMNIFTMVIAFYFGKQVGKE